MKEPVSKGTPLIPELRRMAIGIRGATSRSSEQTARLRRTPVAELQRSASLRDTERDSS